jgi:hypothetical protein
MDGAYQRMLESLRDTFGKRLPMGLSPAADSRLQRTLNHYVREVIRVQGGLNEQDVLRETFDSMAGWFRRNTGAIRGSPLVVPVATPPPPTIATATAVSPEPALSFAVPLEEQDPIALFERIKANRAAAAGAPIPTVSTPIPQLPAELMPLETRPAAVGAGGALQPKDFLQRQEDVIKYRETEYNLILNSKDRDWLAATTENRYSFTVQLDSVARPQGSGAQATITNRFRNIVRLEFIKAVLPVEGLEVAIPRDCATATPTPEQAPITVLSLPFVQVMLDEHQANNFGTNPTTDKSFAICQYDATWRSEHAAGGADYTNSRGYTLFFPKFMKAQRVYAPAPLASLNKLSFQLLNPEDAPLSAAPDALRVKRVLWGSDPDASGSCYDASGGTAAAAEYLFIETTTWFPLWSFGRNDRVAFKGLIFTSATADIQKAGVALNQWLERDEGHIVVGTGFYDASSGVFVDGWNDCGYANTVIVRNRYEDPTTGSCARYLWTTDEGTLATEMAAYDTTGYQRGGILNLSRQVQLFLRVIVRDVDPGSSTRPDNV